MATAVFSPRATSSVVAEKTFSFLSVVRSARRSLGGAGYEKTQVRLSRSTLYDIWGLLIEKGGIANSMTPFLTNQIRGFYAWGMNNSCYKLLVMKPI